MEFTRINIPINATYFRIPPAGLRSTYVISLETRPVISGSLTVSSMIVEFEVKPIASINIYSYVSTIVVVMVAVILISRRK
ncbi:MAG: hypothetical protein NDF55_00885 [archaeon GB-1867-005]|nr:hypothetical protein [Candidatus Culexmicrobium cathedralense]